jgi:nucleoside-diphosphate-sugar epimerase
MHGHQRRAGKHCFRRPLAIFKDRRAVIVRSQPDIQACMDARRYAATPSEKAVRDIAQRGAVQSFDFIGRHSLSVAVPSALGNMLDGKDMLTERRAMTGRMLIFGMGYTASRLAQHLHQQGWQITGTRREASDTAIAFDDGTAVFAAMASATHILSSVPPQLERGDPVLEQYGDALAASPATWIGYLSSTGVYGDTAGAWVDESATIGAGRRSARAEADLAWQNLRDDVHVFRLPGIYGPGRSALERVLANKAHRIDLPGQIFSRIHVDDIVGAVCASFDAPCGVYNIADNHPCSQNAVIEHACDLLGIECPKLQTLDEAKLSPMARGFYAENRRVANGKAKRLLGWQPLHSDYRAGLLACMATSNPAMTSTAPDEASMVQR